MRVVNVGIICTSRQDIQSLVKFQAVILVKLPCVYSTASTAPIGPLAQLAIRMQSLAVINDAIEKGNGRQASLPQKPWPLVYSLCQKFLITVLGTPSSAGFQFNQLGTGYFPHDMKDGCN